MTEPSKLVQKAIGRSNTTWNSVKQRAVAGVGELEPVLVLHAVSTQMSDYT